jgi:hypothetical protein
MWSHTAVGAVAYCDWPAHGIGAESERAADETKAGEIIAEIKTIALIKTLALDAKSPNQNG